MTWYVGLTMTVLATSILALAVWRRRTRSLERRSPQSWQRVLVHVDQVGSKFTRVTVPQWSTSRSADIPTADIPAELLVDVQPGTWLIAKGDVLEPEGEDLHLRDFARAPEPIAEGRLVGSN